MSRVSIRNAMEAHLATLAPEWKTAWDNDKFTPDAKVNWQRASMHFADTRPAGVGPDAGEQWSGFLQVTLFIPANSGPQDAEARAALLRGDRARGITGHFFRGQTLVEDGLRITIHQPTDGQPIEEAKWWGLPIRIPFHCFAL